MFRRNDSTYYRNVRLNFLFSEAQVYAHMSPSLLSVWGGLGCLYNRNLVVSSRMNMMNSVPDQQPTFGGQTPV